MMIAKKYPPPWDIKMNYELKPLRRRSIRLKDFDYSQCGGYFITICTRHRKCLFGDINDDQVKLNKIGKIAQTCWEDIPNHYPSVVLDEYIIMPNHLHGIILIDHKSVEAKNFEPQQFREPTNQFQQIIPRSIGCIIRGYKIGVTQSVRANTNIDIIWQRNFYEHVIRDDKELAILREYIAINPHNWKTDEFFSGNDFYLV